MSTENIEAQEKVLATTTTAPSPPQQPVEEQQQQESKPQPIAGTETVTPWTNYLNSLNSKYQQRIQRMAQVSNYKLNIRYEDGREETQVYTRMKLLQWQFDEIEDLRAEATELAAKSPREAQKALSAMYLKASGYILFNTKKSRPMSADEYRHCVFSEVRPALDAAMLLGLISDPN